MLGEKLERTADRNKKGGVKLEYIDSHTKNKNTKLPRIVLKIHRHNVINTIKHNNIRVSTMNHILSILYKQLSYFYRVNPANPSIPKDIDKKEKEH
ncbi:MAG: hypothetical protein QM532_03690 [Cyanobium sp. MAG06]|nr:hypothetical protein [Cyanobium sp. MAG06]